MERFEGKNYKLILQEIKFRKKLNHWMWWGFPIHYNSWGNIKVSEITQYYSLKDIHDVKNYLLITRDYYPKALELLSDFTFYELKDFFQHDFDKFKSHIHYFIILKNLLGFDQKTVSYMELIHHTIQTSN